MLTTLLIDLDDTILDFRLAEANAIRTTLSELDLPHDDETIRLYSRINDEEWKRLERGETTRDRLVVHRFERLFEALGVTRDAPVTKRIYERRLGDQHTYLPGAREALETLATRYDLYLVSNGTCIVQDRRLADAALLPLFREVFISERVGLKKPDASFFDHVFTVIGEERRATAAIIGDSLTSDIRGGVNAGIRTVWVNTRALPADPALTPTLTVPSLAEAVDLLPLL